MSMSNPEMRSFTIEKADLKEFVPGRFEAKTPRAAAAKAGRRLFQQLEAAAKAEATAAAAAKAKGKGKKKAASEEEPVLSKKEEVKFTLRETTRDSAGKEFTYIAVKHKLDEPLLVSRAGVDITISHAYKVRSCKA